ncbi:sigma-54-dependent Fis family transcriptional regulator [Petroclostridium sp. X23]|uniref:sigma-54-dependent Fis family transcriptional regulator n=1 Tax=Petroclostridium sp. X23 TaxID=3045146 RepID=UPI0024AD7247|nr:sigma-54-dependent Fis family transcriptional regulator [Petroclostridium sp. X23]WHH57043.1 sigma-54-dependent Fis family transcriptional regulator [Petroclostridium sp. X23]
MLDEIEKYKRAWERYVRGDSISEELKPGIVKSWERCKRLNVNPYGGAGNVISQQELDIRLREKRELLAVAKPVMDNIYEIIKDTSYSVVLTDQDSILLDIIENEGLKAKHRRLNFVTGTRWDEKNVGNNAIGTCLAIDQPVQVIGAEHYCIEHHGWTCSAAPIHDSNGKIIGCLDLSGNVEDVHTHTFGIVVASVKNIEKQLSIIESHKLMNTAFDSILDGLIVIGNDYKIKRINNKIPEIFKMDVEDIYKLDIREMLKDTDIEDAIFKQRKQIRYTDYSLCIPNNRVDCLLNISPIEFNEGVMGAVLVIREAMQVRKEVNKIVGFKANYSFENIVTKDFKMLSIISSAKKIAKTNCAVLIEGESGTGKELFAQSIHNASPRAKGPFIAINCATLPKELVESELFGYEKGAFTGALKEGKPGKFELANGGTIFLDEIGEIPLEIQAKLLRVLDNHKVRRIGGTYERELDVRVIAATNRDLYEEVMEKTFRRDLYYRLNVIDFKLMPLRERAGDIIELAKFFLKGLNEENPYESKYFDDSFLEKICTFEWKGNIRELQNIIQRAYYLCEDNCIDDTLLPQIYTSSAQERGVSYQNKTFQQIEKESIINALISSDGNVLAAADILNISKSTIYRKIKEYEINTQANILRVL